jgi:diadenosine tetraphosphate (Ap4A) HIT family hydrolase
MTTDTRTEPGCPFCRSNSLLRGDIIASTDNAYLINAQGSESYLVIPENHVESVQELTDNWWQEVKTLIEQVPSLTPDYNLSINIGKIAGQTVKHLHLWIIPRADGQPASNNGLASLIQKINQTD